MEDKTTSPSAFAESFDARPTALATSTRFSAHAVNTTPLTASTSFTEPVLGLYTSGRHRMRRRQGGRLLAGWSDPGTINVSPANAYATWEADGSSRAIVMFLQGTFLSRVVLENWEVDPCSVEIVPQFLMRDPVIEAVVTQLATEARSDSSSGLLYAESACEFLGYHVLRRYSTLSKAPPRPRGGLPAHRLKAVRDYIEDNLGSPIALRELAALARVGVRHFERAFRQSTGMPPHRYVQERRVSAARDLLIYRQELSIEEVARRLGFSSPSHFSSTFVRRVGCAPAAFRRMHN